MARPPGKRGLLRAVDHGHSGRPAVELGKHRQIAATIPHFLHSSPFMSSWFLKQDIELEGGGSRGARRSSGLSEEDAMEMIARSTQKTKTKRRRSSSLLLLPLLLICLSWPPLPASASFSGPIQTVVVLVMENRSFDHMLGWMKRLNPAIDGVTGKEWNRLNATDPASPQLFFRDEAHYVDPDPGHSFQAIREQVFGSADTSASPPPMNGFAQQAKSMEGDQQGNANMSRDVMNGFRPETVTVYTELVKQFAVCDRWFASVPAATQPNRLYVHSGTSHGATSNFAWHALSLS